MNAELSKDVTYTVRAIDIALSGSQLDRVQYGSNMGADFVVETITVMVTTHADEEDIRVTLSGTGLSTDRPTAVDASDLRAAPEFVRKALRENLPHSAEFNLLNAMIA